MCEGYTSALVTSPARHAVFVDPSGRRRRFARRAGLLLVVPAAGHVALLASTLVGGPTVHTPLVPVPDGVRPQSKPGPMTAQSSWREPAYSS